MRKHGVIVFLMAVLLALASTRAVAGPTVKVTATGTITSGQDGGTLTGALDLDLSGETVTIVHTLQNPSAPFTSPGLASEFYELVSVTITIGARTITIDDSVVPDLSGSYTLAALTGSQDARLESTVNDPTFSIFSSSILLSSPSDDFLGGNLDTSRNLTFPAVPAGGGWRFGASLFDPTGIDILWDFSVEGQVSRVSVDVTGRAVPEPATGLGVMLGLAALTVVRRRPGRSPNWAPA